MELTRYCDAASATAWRWLLLGGTPWATSTSPLEHVYLRAIHTNTAALEGCAEPNTPHLISNITRDEAAEAHINDARNKCSFSRATNFANLTQTGSFLPF